MGSHNLNPAGLKQKTHAATKLSRLSTTLGGESQSESIRDAVFLRLTVASRGCLLIYIHHLSQIPLQERH